MEEKRKKTILVIDDMSESLRMVKTVLEDIYTVRLAKSGELAKPILNTFMVDLILLDIEMPDISGFEYVDWLKQNPVTRHIPVLFLSSHSEPDIVEQASRHDVKGYMKKPVDPNVLRKRIFELLSKD